MLAVMMVSSMAIVRRLAGARIGSPLGYGALFLKA
jgi:hypothetical protein